MWSMALEFQKIIGDRWSMAVGGHVMYQIVHKMKLLKKDLKALNKGLFSNVEHSADMALQLLHLKQTELQANPTDLDLLLAEKEAATSARFLIEAKHRFLTQRSKAKWVREGDDNTAYFHNYIKERRQSNRVVRIKILMVV
ncbi:hypothetical protein vseg_007359 [Gypsophila vaccaria]